MFRDSYHTPLHFQNVLQIGLCYLSFSNINLSFLGSEQADILIHLKTKKE